ncbi:HNH endonuclease signature motif containing protein [Hymenobacter saemangeumensis]|uniref:HNH endonuclease signature motif containing protein n=1 Tax=Hymenobacter saemangeumensis TaxID=1084522 RepID=A0ABP8IJ21_9BACT
MSNAYINAALRRQVASRATNRCEYCHLAEEDTFLGCQVDHIISEKHGGPTTAENLAYACTFCNQRKGSDIASLATGGTLVRLFNPRTDEWAEHFAVVGLIIQAKTPIAEATIRLLAFNTPERILEREALVKAKRFFS